MRDVSSGRVVAVSELTRDRIGRLHHLAGEDRNPIFAEPFRGSGHADGGKYPPVSIADGGCYAVHPDLMLTLVDGKTLASDFGEFARERRLSRDRIVGKALETILDDLGDHPPILKREDRLPDARAISRRGLDQGGVVSRSIHALLAIHHDDVVAVEYPDVDRFSSESGQAVGEGFRLAMEVHVGQRQAAQLKEPNAKTVIPAAAIL